MCGPHDGEVPAVEGRQGGQAQAFGQGHQRGIGAVQGQVGVALGQLSHRATSATVNTASSSSPAAMLRRNATSGAGPPNACSR